MEINDHSMQKGINWLELPDHIASIIVNKLIHIKDYIRFGVVCHSWRTLYIENRHRLPRQPSTLLMLDQQTRSLYNIIDKRTLNFQPTVLHGKFICGSSHGWIVAVVRRKFDIADLSLINPLSLVNNEIQLPPLRADGNVDKVVLSANPLSNSSYVVFAIHGYDSMAYFKSGDDAWTSLPSLCGFVADVVYYIGQFSVVDYAGRVFAYDLNGPQPKVTIVTEDTTPWFGYRRRLIELSGDLLQVCAHAEPVYDDDDYDHDVEFLRYRTAGFFCFKLDSVGLNWIKTDNLCGHALFLGDNHALSVLSSNFPECKPNAIYYIDDYGEGSAERYRDGLGDRNVAVFDLTDRTIEPILSEVTISSPIWIEPTLALGQLSRGLLSECK